MYGGDRGVIWSPRSFSFWDTDKGPSGKPNPEGLLHVTAKVFLVSLSCLLGPSVVWEGIFILSVVTLQKEMVVNVNMASLYDNGSLTREVKG